MRVRLLSGIDRGFAEPARCLTGSEGSDSLRAARRRREASLPVTVRGPFSYAGLLQKCGRSGKPPALPAAARKLEKLRPQGAVNPPPAPRTTDGCRPELRFRSQERTRIRPHGVVLRRPHPIAHPRWIAWGMRLGRLRRMCRLRTGFPPSSIRVLRPDRDGAPVAVGTKARPCRGGPSCFGAYPLIASPLREDGRPERAPPLAGRRQSSANAGGCRPSIRAA